MSLLVRTITSIFLISLIFSCKTQERFYRENELLLFLEVNRSSQKGDRTFVFLISNGSCGSCNETIGSIYQLLTTSFIPENGIIFIFKDQEIEESLGLKIDSSINVIACEPYQLQRYGLDLFADFFFIIQQDKIVFWDYLTKKTEPEIKSAIERL